MSNETHNNRRTRDLVLRFENECDPFKYRVRGFCFWPLFRFKVWQHIKINVDGLTTAQSSRLPRARFARAGAVYAMFKELLGLQALKTKRPRFDVVALTTTDRLRDKIGDSYRNLYLDYFDPPLENALQIFVDSRKNRRSAPGPCTFISPRTVWPRVVLASKRRGTGTDELAALHSDLTAFLEREGHAGALRFPSSFWRLELAHFVARMDSFVDIFKATRPKVVVLECHYDKIWAIAAAKRLNIPVLELQHGILYDGHMAYTYDPAPAERYRDQVPLPDKILTFGRYFTEILTARGFWSPSQVKEVGFPKMEFHQAKFEYQPPKAGEKLRVLVSSQWILTGELIKFLQEAVRRLPENVALNVKPHPSEQDTSAYRRIPGVGVLGATDDFYELMGSHHVHCSVFSTTLLESVGLGIPTMIVGLPGSDNALPMTERGYCKVANSPAEFAALLGEAAGDPAALADWARDTRRSVSYFWEPGASANVRAIVEETVKNRIKGADGQPAS